MFVVQTQDTQRGSSLEWLDVSPPEELEDQEDIGPEILCTTTSASPSRWIDGLMDGWTDGGTDDVLSLRVIATAQKLSNNHHFAMTVVVA